MLWLDIKYANLVGSQLRNFKRKTNDTFNFSCPVCGDSETHKRKARGYLYPNGQQLQYHCHNCGSTMPFGCLLKQTDVQLYDQFRLEQLKEDQPFDQPAREFFATAQQVQQIFGTFSTLLKVSQLSVDHIAKVFVDKRKIPTTYHHKLFYADKFKTFVNTVVPGKFEIDKIGKDEPRLIIPMIDNDKSIIGFQGRALLNSAIKYITIMVDESRPKIYGLDTVDLSKRVYTFEGPIDSMFINNAIATAGGDLEAADAVVSKNDNVIVYDNEPRSIHTIRKMVKAINHGYHVCIWPDSIAQKDINDMVLSGYMPEYLKQIIDNNTYQGLRAHAAISQWKKC